MNARQYFEVEPSVAEIERVVDRMIDGNDPEFGDWDGNVTADTEREHSDYFGLISGFELRKVQYNPDASAEQIKAASMELRRRFIDDLLELITARAEKDRDDAEEADFERRFCRA